MAHVGALTSSTKAQARQQSLQKWAKQGQVAASSTGGSRTAARAVGGWGEMQGLGWLSSATEDPEVAGTFIWAVWAASSSQRGQAFLLSLKAWPLRETLSLYCCPSSSPLCAGKGRGDRGTLGGSASAGSGRDHQSLLPLPMQWGLSLTSVLSSPAPLARWPSPVQGRLLPAPEHVLRSQHSPFSACGGGVHW